VALLPAQVAALSTADIVALTTAQVDVFTSTQIGAITTADIAALTTAQIVALTTAQVATGLLPSQLGAMSTAQLASMTTAQTAALTPFQLTGLGAPPPYALNMQKAFNVDRMVLPTNQFWKEIPTGLTYKTGVMPINGPTQDKLYGLRAIVAAFKSTQVVTITIQRYLDAAGLMPVGAAGTQALTANVSGYAIVNDNVPALFFDVQVANASGSLAVISNPGIAVSANA
jgi:hypothetical protein